MVTLPPWVVENVPGTAVTPAAGWSFASREPVSTTKGVAGDEVLPPVTTASVLLTRFAYASDAADGWMAIENAAEPLQLLFVSVAVTVKANVPVAVGVPLIAPPLESE